LVPFVPRRFSHKTVPCPRAACAFANIGDSNQLNIKRDSRVPLARLRVTKGSSKRAGAARPIAQALLDLGHRRWPPVSAMK